MKPLDLQSTLHAYIFSPKDARICFELGYAYEKLQQRSSAVTYYIKALEYSTNLEFRYEVLIRLGLLLSQLGRRDSVAKGLIERACSTLPARSEAYYLLCTFYEKSKSWSECYMMSNIALMLTSPGKFETDIYYPGEEGLLFYKGLSAWWVDKPVESLKIMRALMDTGTRTSFESIAGNNVDMFGPSIKKPSNTSYTYFDRHNLKVKFKDVHLIERNYSEAGQDLFVLMCTQGKHNGTFIEIGCAVPVYHNNTYLLESTYSWSGISMDVDKEKLDQWGEVRRTVPLLKDARTVDWTSLLTFPHYDYLQVDCEPGEVSLQILYSLPLGEVEFSVITFEHDHYTLPRSEVRQRSREYLQSFGYELVIGNVSSDWHRPYEDWWVHPNHVDRDVIERLKRPHNDVNPVVHCLFLT